MSLFPVDFSKSLHRLSEDNQVFEIDSDNDSFNTNDLIVFNVHHLEDPTCKQYLAIIEVSGILSFWDDPEEDVYNSADGEPV